MYGVTKITTAENIMLIRFDDSTASFMGKTLQKLADADVIVDMISQTAPCGSKMRFSFTASFAYFPTVMKVIGAENKPNPSAPMVSGGYSKINLFGEEMVDSVGVAARALCALNDANIEIALITTSDLDISLLLRQEEQDIALELLKKTYSL